MPVDYSKYPPNWEELRSAVRERSGGLCEHCKEARDGETGFRDGTGRWIPTPNLKPGTIVVKGYQGEQYKTFKMVITCAHLDHDEENWNVSIDRLADLCPKCHFEHDKEDNRERRKENKYRGTLFPYERKK